MCFQDPFRQVTCLRLVQRNFSCSLRVTISLQVNTVSFNFLLKGLKAAILAGCNKGVEMGVNAEQNYFCIPELPAQLNGSSEYLQREIPSIVYYSF